MDRTLFFLFLFISHFCFSQTPKLSRYEKRWAIIHPFAALKVKKITKRCYVVYNQPDIRTQLDTFSNGGKLDAFRHAFFMAAYAQKIKPKKLRKLGIAHEKENYRQFLKGGKEEGETPDSLSSVMDLNNNELGFNIGIRHKKADLEEIKSLVFSALDAGKAIMMRRNKAGLYLDCNGYIIKADRLKLWAAPKCILWTNFQEL